MHHSQPALTQTYSHFAGVTTVNTRYLYRPKRLRPAEGATVLAGPHASEPLAKIPGLEIVRLLPLLYQNQTLIEIRYSYNRQIYHRLKESKVRRWLPENRCFVLPTDNQGLHTLVSELAGVVQIWLCQTLRVREVHLLKRLWEQRYQQPAGFISCPLPYLERLLLLNYSLNTIRTYYSLLLRFLNGHQAQGLDGINAFTEAEINQYHRGLVQSKKYSCSLINQRNNAVKFYYQQILGCPEVRMNNVERPEKPEQLSGVLSKAEVVKILGATDNLKHRCLLQLLYAGG
jgi:integrase/recombinase XerD